MSEHVEPLHDLILVEVERESMLSEHIHASAVHAGVQSMRVVACGTEYINHMGVTVPIKVRPGDHVRPKMNWEAHCLPVQLDVEARAAIVKRNREAGKTGEEALPQGVLGGEVVLLPYTQLACKVPPESMVKVAKKLPKVLAPAGGRGEYQ